MTLYINDRVFEQMVDLPKSIARKVVEFQRKFKQDPHQTSLNLEHIHDFKDRNLRTARIDQKYRTIIAGPMNDNDYYMLWVDNHDEAMEWARNKVFQWNEATRSVQLFTIPSEIDVKSDAVAPDAPRLFSAWDDDTLLRVGVPQNLLPVIRGITDLNGLEGIERDLPAEVFEHLFQLTDGVDVRTIIEEVQEGLNPSTGSGQSVNHGRHFVEVSDQLMQDAINGDLEKWQVFLHPSQRMLVESSYSGSFKLSGGAGTGKTVVALHRFRYLSQRATEAGGGKVVFTTFTLQLTDHLRQLAGRMGVDKVKESMLNIDALARELGMRHQIITPSTIILDQSDAHKSKNVWVRVLEDHPGSFDADFMFREYQELILQKDIRDLAGYLVAVRNGMDQALSRRQRMEVWELIKRYQDHKRKSNLIDRGELFNATAAFIRAGEHHPFRHLVADEVQDLSNVELRFLRSLVPEGPDDLFLVGDPYQRIYARHLNFGSVGISVRGRRSKKLRINYRTSEEIKCAALSTVKSLKPDDFEGEGAVESLDGYLSLFHGQRPSYHLYQHRKDEVQALLQAVQMHHASGVPYSGMAIGVRLKASMDPFRDALHRAGIPYSDKISQKRNDRTGILLSTLHGLKGLEFKVVFLVDVTDATCPFKSYEYASMSELKRKDWLHAERSLLYVAMSRAVNFLYVSGTGVRSEMVRV